MVDPHRDHRARSLDPAAALILRTPPRSRPRRRSALRCAAMDDAKLLEQVRVIEARHAALPTGTPIAQAAAALCTTLSETRAREPDATHKVTLPDPWRRAIFAALCRRYGLHLHRHARPPRQTVMVCAPPSFFDRDLWREFTEVTDLLMSRFDRITEAVLGELRPGDAREVSLAMVDGYGGAERDP